MGKTGGEALSRRERQIMDALYRLREASVAEVLEAIPDPPGYSAVRAMLRVLEEKGQAEHVQDGPRYLYRPTTSAEEASRSALRRVLATFFDDSPERAVAALLDVSGVELTDADLDRLEKQIADARKDGR